MLIMCNKIRYSGLHRQLLRFIVVGGSNTVLTYGLYIVLLSWLGFQIAYTIAYGIGIIVSYFLNAKAVFRIQTSLPKLFLFSLVYMLQLGGGAVLMYVLVIKLRVPKELAPVAVLFVMVPSTFLLVRAVMRR